MLPEFYRQHCAQRNAPVFNFTQRPILRFFAPQGRHVAPIGMKFGTEEGTEGPLPSHEGTEGSFLRAKFHPHRCNDKGVGPQKLNLYFDLTKMWNINARRGRIPCAIFTKFAAFVPHFGMR